MKEKRYTKKQVIYTILLTAALTLGGVLLLLFGLLGKQGLSVMEGYLLVRYLFVEDADMQKVADSALGAMAEATGDRWTYYLDEEWNKAQTMVEANESKGIGIRVLCLEEGLLITDVVPDSGADRAGLKPGEYLIRVGDQPLYGEVQQQNLELIQGKTDTLVDLTVLAEDGSQRTVSVLRGVWFDPPVRTRMLEGKIGYVRLFNFHTGSANALQTAVDGLVEQGAEKLIFDVRQNGGGYVKELTQMLDYLLPEGVVFQQSTDWGWSHRKESDAACIDLPMTVLMDGGSYSCAELFAAQLKESAGARLVGEHTVGKGYFQYYFPILNGGRLGLSIGRYTTGAGVWLAKTGLEPDIEISLSQEELTYFNARWLAVEEDPQLQAAILGEE